MATGKVLVVMVSDSDFPVMEGCFKILKRFGVEFEAHVASARLALDGPGRSVRAALAEQGVVHGIDAQVSVRPHHVELLRGPGLPSLRAHDGHRPG